jgi:hypothetical protein
MIHTIIDASPRPPNNKTPGKSAIETDLRQNIDALVAENKRLREALKESRSWMEDGMSSYKWLEAFKVITAALGGKE